MIEWLAVWYLNRVGRAVLSRTFIGFAVGYGTATKMDTSNDSYDVWEITVPNGGKIVALNNSIVIADRT